MFSWPTFVTGLYSCTFCGGGGAFLLYHLASNPEKQEKLYQELRDVLGPSGGGITEAKLAKLKYLKVK